MNYFMSISSAQWILIDLGVLLQVVAIIAVCKQRMGYRMLPPGGHPTKSYDPEEMTPDRPHENDPAHEYAAPHGRRGSSMKGGELTQTSKAPFKQEFKFRQCR